MYFKYAQVLDKARYCHRICLQYNIDDIGKLYNASMGTFVIWYADDILLMAPSVSTLQNLL